MTDQLSSFAEEIYRAKRYDFDGTESWDDTARRQATVVLGALGYGERSDEVHAAYDIIRRRLFIPGGRYLYSVGRPLHQTQNCLLLRAEDTREGWSDTYWKANTALMTGAGIGIEYSDLRGRGSYLKRTGGFSSGPNPHVLGVDYLGRAAVQGGSRRAAIWAGLHWKHPDVFDFIKLKDWSPEMRAIKEKDQDFPLPGEYTNISVGLDDEFFAALEDGDSWATDVYWQSIDRMLRTGEPGFAINRGESTRENLRNACTEITSADDSDVCNLGSANLSRIRSLEEMLYVTEIGSLFLLAGTVYSDVPYEKVADVREKNRRLGLGVMGVHDWLLQRGLDYRPNDRLHLWMHAYTMSERWAAQFADRHNLSRPVKTRAIAPTGTIAMIGETTTGCEPVFCAAYARRFLAGGEWQTRYIIDPTVERLVQDGVDPDKIEDAYSLAADPARRIEMQAWLQQYVDHGISSTINLPAPVKEPEAQREFGLTLLKDLPKLRGVTVYPDGARSGQPLQPVPYATARAMQDVVVTESEERCVSGACGI